MMKTCPVCHARCFEDMEVCFGCLYRFEAVDDGGLDEALAADNRSVWDEDEGIAAKEAPVQQGELSRADADGGDNGCKANEGSGSLVIRIEIPASVLCGHLSAEGVLA